MWNSIVLKTSLKRKQTFQFLTLLPVLSVCKFTGLFLVCWQLFSQADPKELIQVVTKHVTQYSYTDWPEEIATLINQLHYYNERLLDFTQAQILQGLGKGVDVQRFTADGQYKRETILGLAE